MRVTHYHASVYHSSTGSSSAKDYPFTQVQADEVGGVLVPDGLDTILAAKLCEKWTRRGNHGDIVYRYSLRIEDQLAALDKKGKP